MTPLPATPGALGAIQRASAAKGLDWRPLASVAQYESGLNPRALGDGGHAFGLFQNNNAGGTITGDPNPRRFFDPNVSAGYTANALSKLGLQGMTPEQQLHAIVYRYERPADPGKEYAAALANYRTRYAGLAPQARAQAAQPSPATPPRSAPVAGTPQASAPVAPPTPNFAPLQAGFALSQQSNQRALDALGKLSGQNVMAPQSPNLAALMQFQQPTPVAPLTPAPLQTTAPTPVRPTAPTAPTAPLGTGIGRGGFGLPLPATDHYGRLGVPYQGTHKLYGNWESDNAVDMGTKIGTPIYAVADGSIGSQIGALNTHGAANLEGLRVHLVTHGNEVYYAHLSKLAVKAGQQVKKGQLIGYSGEAGGTPHLHIGVEHGDPRKLFNY